MRKLVAPATATLLASLACGGAPLEGSAAPTQSGAPPSVDAPGVLSAYTALKDTGCDPIAAGIDSP
ncbi:MAG: hypothetical protein JXX28_16300, partial [Deltaproteobacteria bacterium]|nr:hypothetical protein [Deltaproteobacteria bacterium]